MILDIDYFAYGDTVNMKGLLKRILSTHRYKVAFALLALVLPFMTFIALNASAEALDGKGYFKKGIQAIEDRRYEDAVKELSVSQKEFPLLGDYAMLNLSAAYHELGEHDKSLETVRMMLQKYPQSPLVKKARLFEIREAKENSQENLLRLYESYVRDYQEDEESAIMYGLLLKKSGEAAKARDVFKKVYMEAGVFSSAAYAELAPGDIRITDLIERAVNLTRRSEYREAERDLKKALSMDDGQNRDELLRNLAYCLFRQKEYREAAALYDRIHDTYLKARSLYRAGDKEEFDRALNDLLAGNDERTGDLLVAVAADRRREKNLEEALRMYNYVLAHFPAETENALWGIGWTYYMTADYKKSVGIFSGLYSKYGDPKYLYWQARSVEADGGDARDLYRSLSMMENNFYSAAASVKNKDTVSRPVLSREPLLNVTSEDLHRFDRVEALLSLEMNREAVTELIGISRSLDSPSLLMYAVSKFQELGEFRRAIRLATMNPYSEKLHRFWYPLAFWDDVEKISKKNDMDPFVVLAVMREESRFDTDARSVTGAVGLMQIMPKTAYLLDRHLKLGINRESQISDAINNITLGSYYLRSLYDEFKSLSHAVAAYNAGDSIVKKWEQQGNYKSDDEFIEDIPYPETRNYVKKVLTSFYQYKRSFPFDTAGSGFDILPGKL